MFVFINAGYQAYIPVTNAQLFNFWQVNLISVAKRN